MKFIRGAVVQHKVMGRGTVLKEVEEDGEKMIQVRMKDGIPQNFFPEELEDEADVHERTKRIAEEVHLSNVERAKKIYGL